MHATWPFAPSLGIYWPSSTLLVREPFSFWIENCARIGWSSFALRKNASGRDEMINK